MASSAEIINGFEGKARQLVQSGQVKQIDFSGRTYQLQVVENKKEFWPFLQFNEREEIKDYFCSCESEEDSCIHLAAAVLRIYQGHQEPLHERFRKSLWNVLCQIFGERQGYAPKRLIKEGPGHFVIETVTHKRLFCVEGKSESACNYLESIIEKRVQETEETSLKFSGLPFEELVLWREGRPSLELRYELSFWSDLAKWLLLFQDEGDSYQVTFQYGESGLPNELYVQFPQVMVQFYLSQANLSTIIPSLATVHCELIVRHVEEEAIEKITYDKLSGCLQIHSKYEPSLDEKKGAQKEGIPIGEWMFVPKEGFYSQEQHTLLLEPVIDPKRVEKVLTEHTQTIASHLVDAVIHKDRVALSYTLHFNSEWELHIQSYLFNPGDLNEGNSRLFGSWAFLDDDGFYPLEEPLFKEAQLVIPAKEISDFVHRYRFWLNTQKGFHTHLTTLESQLTFRLSKDNELIFESRVEVYEEASEGKDFGEWIYVAGQGFYSKIVGKKGQLIRSGLVIKEEEIPLFIRMHQEDLELIEGFFAKQCPVVSAGLEFKLLGQDKLLISPRYELYPKYTLAVLKFFEDFVYVPGEGFSQIPLGLSLPKRFSSAQTLKGGELQLFFAHEFPQLRSRAASLDRRLSLPKGLQLVVKGAQRQKGETQETISLDLSYRSPLGEVSLFEIWNALNRAERYLCSNAGLLDLKEPQWSWIRQLPFGRSYPSENLELSPLELMRLSVMEKLECAQGALEAQRLLEAFASFRPSSDPVLVVLRSELRHYQLIGVNWLWFLYQNSLSGLLCDDMGLGKTHQAMALMAAAFHELKALPDKSRPRYLIVCPTSVIYHWKEKLAQYLPDLTLYTFYGAERTFDKVVNCDILLTSYGILRYEQSQLEKLFFEIAIYDEIQIAKNQNSRTHAALLAMRARMRVGLTGTPIENNLRELKALFDIVLPTYLPSEMQFREQFVIPIEKEQDFSKQRLLHRIVKPFVLRRRKEEVLTELPEKIEEKAHCELSLEQFTLYNDLLQRQREGLIRELQDDSNKSSYLHVFSLLSSLKQVCDHPALYHKDLSNYKKYTSGKWELFIELLSQAREGKQKVVIFSQYLGMLDIIELYLQELQIGYAGIRGSTLKREEEIKRFHLDPSCEIFVASLQAAGLGIDLTAASIVIHYDRWWNAARENQATDRVHRIGQTRGVQVFKLLTLGTFEERIDAMIEHKGSLMEEVIGSDDHRQIKSFTKEELIELLSLPSIRPKGQIQPDLSS